MPPVTTTNINLHAQIISCKFTMASIILPKHKFFCLTLLLIAACCSCSGYAEDNPAQTFVTALACFRNKFIYAGCNEAYRLNERGEFNVPPEATNSFCHGPCFEETQQVLNCVDRMFSNFVFGNRATLPELRSALRAGCSYTNQIGRFNGFGPFGQYQGETSSAQKLPKFVSFFTLLIVTGFCLLIEH